MSYSKKLTLENNIKIIELVLSGQALTPTDLSLLKEYKGFGGLKSTLLDHNIVERFPKSETSLQPLFQQLHQIILKYRPREYESIISSIQKSVLTSFYTPKEIISTINTCFANNNIVFNKFLDPSSGTGAFLDIEAKEKVAFEKDYLTGLILSKLNPSYNVNISPFESINTSELSSFDLVASNIPFGQIPIFDPLFMKNDIKSKASNKIHNYFLFKGLDTLREGGILAYITSTGTMDSMTDLQIRKELLKASNLISAVRLPQNLFEDSGTSVQSDLILLQKNSKKSSQILERENEFINGSFYDKNPSNIIYSWKEEGTNMYGKPSTIYIEEGGINIISSKLENIINKDLGIYYSKDLFNKIKKEVIKRDRNTSIKQLSLFDIPTPILGVKRGKTRLKHTAISTPIQTSFFDLPIPPIPSPPTIIDDYNNLKVIYYKLSNYENNYKTPDENSRELLNIEYDNFIEKHGKLNKITNKDLLANDSFNELKSLEINGSKSDIFFEPISFSTKEIIYNINDALYKSLDLFNKVDIPYICAVSFSTQDEVLKDLGSIISYNPIEDNYELTSAFLSGNIVSKISKIEILKTGASSDKLALIDFSLKALEKAIPQKINLLDIGINLGERWIPKNYYIEFARSIFKTLNPHHNVELIYNEVLDIYKFNRPWIPLDIEKKYTVDSANRTFSPYRVLEIAMVNNIPNMTKKVMDSNGKETRIADQKGITAMNNCILNIQTEFKYWLESLPNKQAEELETIYNNKFNCFVKQSFDGNFQTFPHLNIKGLGITDLYSSQKDAILHIKSNYGGIIDHEVSGGKTLISCVASYEMKRLGIAKKPLIIGLKTNLDQIIATYKLAYPTAKVLAPSEKDFSPANRQIFFGKIQNNNWDVIIMTHDQFMKIPQSVDIEIAIIKEELTKIESAFYDLNFDADKSFRAARKGLEKRKESLEVNLLKLTDLIASKKDNIVDFKTMGIDKIFVDESHEFKNLAYTTKHSRVSGLGTPQGSQKAFNLLITLRTIQEKIGKDLGATFLSGTILSNSLTELYNVFNFLCPKSLLYQNITSFDSWLATYAEKSTDIEFDVTNRLKLKERFRQFKKVPELAKLYSSITNYKTAHDIGLDRPDIIEHLVEIEKTELQTDMFNRLQDFAETGDAKLIFRRPLSESEETAKMLIATTTSRKASLDIRLTDHPAEETGKTKVDHCVENLVEQYKKHDSNKGTQLVFCDFGVYKTEDTWSVYSQLKQQLIENNIPEKEIQFIQNYNNSIKKQELQLKVNQGEIRILIGGSKTLGTGLNVQNRIVAMHHLDIPWTPKDLTQRNGRGQRAGNEIAKLYCDNKVEVFIYAVKQTLDVYMFNLIATKDNFIRQIKDATITTRTIDEGAMEDGGGMNFHEYIAILSGDTNLLDKSKIEKQLSTLRLEESLFFTKLNDYKNSENILVSKIIKTTNTIDNLTTDLDSYNEITKSIGLNDEGQPTYSITLLVPTIDKNNVVKVTDERKEYKSPEEAGIILNTLIEAKFRNIETEIGKFRGFPIIVKNILTLEQNQEQRIYIKGINTEFSHNNGRLARTAEIAGLYPIKALERLPFMLEVHQKELKTLEENLSSIKNNPMSSFFPKNAKIIQLEAHLKDIIIKIKTSLEPKQKNNNISITE